ncbi:MAG: hypothetical protein AMXMBFR25_22050 [Lysobacterales bacterium]
MLSLACGALLVALCVDTTLAEAPELDPPCAVRRAWSNHPTSQATEHTLAAARARAEAAGMPLYNPDLELAVDAEGDDRTTTAGLSLTLDLSGKRGARRALGSAEFDLAAAEAGHRRSSFARQWLQASAEHRSALARSTLGQRRLDLMQRFADLAQRQFEAGDISAPERDLAGLARDQAEAEQATLLAELAIAEEAFRALGGDPQTVRVAKDCPASAAWEASQRFDPWQTPEGRIALASSQAAERRVDSAGRDQRADPTVSINAGRIEVGSASDNVLALSVSVPLRFRNPYRAEVIAARAEADATLAEQARIERELKARADRALQSSMALDAAWRRWRAGPGSKLDERADLMERLWRAGELSTADYLAQLNQSLDTAFAGVDLQGRASRAQVDALYATGRLDAWVGFDAPLSENTP